MDWLLEHLRDRGLLDEAAAERVAAEIAAGKPFDTALHGVASGNEAELLEALGAALGFDLADLTQMAPSRDLLGRFPARVLLQHNLLPLSEDATTLRVATSRALDPAGLDILRLHCGKAIEPMLAPESEIERSLKAALGVGADTLQSLVSTSGELEVLSAEEDSEADLADAAQDASIIRLVNQVLSEAVDLKATDVHIEPFENSLRVRYRVDGVLVEAGIPAEVRRFHAAIVSRLKILSHLDIAEKRVPQDGRIKLKIDGREVDVRVSIIPMLHGEAVVLRLLDRGAPLLGLENLGMSARDREIFERVLEMPHGIVLVTGPTGSGKTTSLYAALAQMNSVARKIVTIEDPVEYHLAGINQIQVATKAGMTFARGLRAILRHDPDVILIGEIRDRETADIAVQASLTGHLVFSTLHTNDAPSAMTRLVDMGIEPYLVASSLELVLAQRLVRLICAHCREAAIPTESEARELEAEFGDAAPERIVRGSGCRACRQTGFAGRNGIFEVMPVTEEIRDLTVARVAASTIREAALRQGMRGLRADGRRLVLQQRTTLGEVLRATKDEVHGIEAPASARIAGSKDEARSRTGERG